MPSQFFDETIAERYRNFQFDFPSESLRDRVILLAGGTGGLGAATAALLLRQGARVVAGYGSDSGRAQRMRDALSEDGGMVIRQSDIATEDGRRQLLDAAGQGGPLFGLVVLTGDPARGATEDVFRHSMEMNCLAPLLLAREAAERMKKAGTQGSIVLFSSMQGGYPFENSSAYASAKAALVHGAKVLAKEVGGPVNIRVNVVAPGATLAGMAQTSVSSGKYDRFVAGAAIPRFGRAEDVARAVVFLLEPDSYITGQVITVDGGLTLRRDLCES